MSRTIAVPAFIAMLLPMAGVSVDAHAPAPTTTPGNCSVVNTDFSVEAHPNTERTDLFSTYGDTSGRWVGGDSTYSAELKNGDIAWIFSDTVLGDVENGESIADPGFINNSIVIERDGELIETHHGGTIEDPLALIQATDEDSWNWIGDTYRHPNGDLQITSNKYVKTGPTLWDFAWDSSLVATIDTETWTVTELSEIVSTTGIQWTSAIERFGSRTYVYGVLDEGEQKSLHVARVSGHDLGKQRAWEYWDGQGWSKSEADAAPIADHVANEVSVTPYLDGYMLITQDTSVTFSGEVYAYFSCTPWGEFTNATKLYHMPEVGADGVYGDPNVYAYNAHEHLHLRDGNTLTFSYNVNTFDNEHIFDDVTIYRPRFVDVTLTPNN